MLYKFMYYRGFNYFTLSSRDNIGYWENVKNSPTVDAIYSSWKKFTWPDTYFLLNINWPSTNLIDSIPEDIEKIIVSFQIEAVDIYWLKVLALKFKKSQIIVVHEGAFYPSQWWPDNLFFTSWITWDEQLRRIASVHGRQDFVEHAKSKLTSLCSRTSQYKFYVTGYMLKNYNNGDSLISYHNRVDKKSDIDHLTTGISAIDDLVEYMKDQKPVTIDDSTHTQRNNDLDNTNWNYRAHTDSVFCLTNEGYHYSYSTIDHQEIIHPGPPLSEKTFKPLLAGQAIIMVGQANSLRLLSKLGFDFDYGLDNSYDSELQDLQRIQMIFKVIDTIMGMSLSDLKKLTREKCLHNSQWAVSEDLKKITTELNEHSLTLIRKKLFANLV